MPHKWISIGSTQTLDTVDRIVQKVRAKGNIMIATGQNCSSFSGQCHTKEGKPCKFPFIYRRKVYNHCSDIDSDAGAWCATQVDQYKRYTAFGYCGQGCPKAKGECH